MNIVVNVCGMEHNPLSLLYRAACVAEHHGWGSAAATLRSTADSVSLNGGYEDGVDSPLTTERVISMLETIGFDVIGHVTSLRPLPSEAELDVSDHRWYTAEFTSTVSPDATFRVRLAGGAVGAFVRDMESSGWWLWIGGHAG